jgi:hypothetical protein
MVQINLEYVTDLIKKSAIFEYTTKQLPESKETLIQFKLSCEFEQFEGRIDKVCAAKDVITSDPEAYVCEHESEILGELKDALRDNMENYMCYRIWEVLGMNP